MANTTSPPAAPAALPLGPPGPPSPGFFFWTCSASSQPDPEDPRGFAPTPILLPPVLMFLPVPLRRAQFKSLSFFFTLPLLCPSSLSIISHSSPFPPGHTVRAGKMDEQHCPDASRQQSAFREISQPPPSPPSISVYLDPSLQIKDRSSQRCQQQRPSNFQVYLGFI